MERFGDLRDAELADWLGRNHELLAKLAEEERLALLKEKPQSDHLDIDKRELSAMNLCDMWKKIPTLPNGWNLIVGAVNAYDDPTLGEYLIEHKFLAKGDTIFDPFFAQFLNPFATHLDRGERVRIAERRLNILGQKLVAINESCEFWTICADKQIINDLLHLDYRLSV